MKIQFIFSNIYENVISKKPITPEKALKARLIIERAWKKEGKKIIHSLEKITGLCFQKDELCYLNSKASFSQPLSIKIEDSKTMLDNLTHELIHVLLTQNYGKIERPMKLFHTKWEKYNFTTRIHILVHAIHLELAEQIFPNRTKHIVGYSTNRNYRTSWEIVMKYGHKKLIGGFKNLSNLSHSY